MPISLRVLCDFNPSRLTLARKRRGLNKITLSRRSGFSVKTLTDFESGRVLMTETAVIELATVLRFPVSFFRRSDLIDPPVDGVSFRSLKSMTASQRDAALAAGALAFEVSGWIDKRFELSPINLPDLREYDNPEQAALVLRSLWGIGIRPIGNMVHLLESQGIRVFSLSERNRKIDAYSLWYQNVPFVFLNTMKTVEHSRMDAAHELGHLVLHRRGSRHGRDAESEAKAFASAFLMPEDSVKAVVPTRLTGPSFHQLNQLKRNWGVSMIALARRLNQLRLLPDWSYRGICVELSKYGRQREPNGIGEREASAVFAKVLAMSKEAGTVKADIAKDLDLYTEDLDELIFGLSVTLVEGNQRRPDGDAEERRRGFRVITSST